MDTQLIQPNLLGKENCIDIWLRVRKYKINTKKTNENEEEKKRKGKEREWGRERKLALVAAVVHYCISQGHVVDM